MIKVQNVSKTYQVWKTPLSRLLVPLAYRFIRPFFPIWFQRFQTEHCQPVAALSNVSFEMLRGGSLGIIGLNGSGKSTLLQIIAGTLSQTSGEVTVEGRVAALLELGTGFDPEFTGRENVYLNASILGLSKLEIDERYNDIVTFADIGEFIDRPVKTYSSGMMVRLAFAVQVHVEPDILIVDEALAVGDARFQAKALTRIEEIIQRGTSLLFVGHDLAAVRSFCDKAMLLDKGNVINVGLPDDVTMDYLQRVQERNRTTDQNKSAASVKVKKGFSLGGVGVRKASIDGFGTHATLNYDEFINIQLDVVTRTESNESLSHPFLIIEIVDARGLQLTGKRIPIPTVVPVETVNIEMQCCFQKGVYRFRMRIVNAPSLEQTELISRQDDLLSLEMIEDVREQFTGLFPVPLKVEWVDA
mgnify:CR=1 FL=1